MVSGILATGRALRGIAVRSPWLRPILQLGIGLLPVFWLVPYAAFLYGTDSYHWIFPFDFNFNPLIQYSYLYTSNFPVPDSAPLFYLDSFFLVLSSAGLSPEVAERLVILLLSILSTVGIFRLFRVINTIERRPPNSRLLGTALAAVLYLMNPFTLTYVWWHFGNYTLFYAFLPLLLSLLLQFVFLKSLPISEACLIAGIGIVLAPGLSGAYAVSAAYAIGACWVAFVVRAVIRHSSLREIVGRTLAFLLFGASILLWTVVPYLLLPNPGFGATNYVTVSNLAQQFALASESTSPVHVLTLLASPWIYDAPDAFGWQGWIPAMEIAALFVPIVYILGIWLSRGRTVFMLLALLSVPVLFLAVGLNAAWGPINLSLVELGGPFLVVESAFTILGPFYVLSFVCGAFLLLEWLLSRLSRQAAGTQSKNLEFKPSTEPPTASQNAYGRILNLTRSRSHLTRRTLLLLGVAALVGALAVSTIPFASGRVYADTGQNIDAIPLPASFAALGSFFQRDYAGPYYYAVVLPISSYPESQVLSFGNQSFDDSTYLLASAIPYPLIWTNNSAQSAALSNYLTSPALGNVSAVLSAFHVRYLVVNQYVDTNDFLSMHSPDGSEYNLTWLEGQLTLDLGPPADVSGFLVFTAVDTPPVVDLQNPIVSVVTSNVSGYVNTISSLDGGQDGWGPTALWSPTAPNIGESLAPSPIRYPVSQTTVPSGDTYYIQSDAGVTFNASNAATVFAAYSQFFPQNRSLIISSLAIANVSNGSNVTTSMSRSDGGYLSNETKATNLRFNGTFDTPVFFSMSFTPIELTSQNWIEVDLVKGAIRIQIQYYLSTAEPAANLGLTAFNNGTPYAWQDYPAAKVTPGSTYALEGWINGSRVSASLSSGNASFGLSGSLDYSYVGPGLPTDIRNASAAPPFPLNLSRFHLQEIVTDSLVLTQSWTVYQQPPIQQVFVGNVTSPPTLTPTALSSDSNGDISLRASSGSPAGSAYVVLAYPYYRLWGLEVGSVTRQSLSIWPLDNVFPVSSDDSFSVGLLTFSAHIDQGLYVSWIELPLLLAIPTVQFVRLRIR
jgi:hypothetical protein